MTKQFVNIDWDEDAKCFCSGRYNINDKIYIEFPTVRQVMFDIGEHNYWSVVFSLVATSSDLIAQLDDIGLDWEKVSDFEIFIRNFIFTPKETINIFLPNINPEDFKLRVNEQNEELMFYNSKDDIVIDNGIYECMSDYIRYTHGIKKNVIRAGNAYTHKDLIDDAHKDLDRLKRKPKKSKSQMKAYISFLANSYGVTLDEILDMKINYFFDAIKRVNAINEATTLPFMIYYGMVDGTKKNVQSRLDPAREDL